MVATTSDTLKFDSLSVAPSSFFILNSNSDTLSPSLYSLIFESANLVLSDSIISKNDSIILVYRCFPFDLTKKHYHKKFAFIADTTAEYQYLYKSPRKNLDVSDPLGLEGFQKSGNLSRGISAGNSQNLSIASDMNLQLAGNITPELRLVASISDNNIPIQPDGNTQQIQDFDAVFMRLEHQNGQLTAGDFLMTSKNSNFLKYSKKSRGAQVETSNIISTKSGDSLKIEAYGGFSIARGKYVKNSVVAIEGNQGPYRLYGADNESYIVILSATEKVYIDGKLMERGENNDYVIDYNTAEITFTHNRLITKDKRIEVEFEYTERVYTRTVLAGGLKISNSRSWYGLNFYSETDLKNQTIDNDLTDEEKSILQNVGDSIQDAFTLSIDSTGFLSDRVMYKMVDSLGFDSVFVYSTNSDSAIYQLTFTYLGAGKGNYVRVQSSANGRVYQWVAPQNGIKQGEFEPIIKLISPKRRQMVAMNMEQKIGKHGGLSLEMAFSENNSNLFSQLSKSDDQGFATKITIFDKRNFGESKLKRSLHSTLSYDFVQKNFNQIERFRDVEFNRDWNNLNQNDLANEHLIKFNIAYSHSKDARLEYGFGMFNKQTSFAGYQNSVLFSSRNKVVNIIGKISNTTSQSELSSTNFMRHNIQISKQLNLIEIGIYENSENNQFKDKSFGTLQANSYYFNEFGGFFKTADTAKVQLAMNFTRRLDGKADSISLKQATLADELNSTISFQSMKNQRLSIGFSLRQLTINDTNLSSLKPENTAQGRLDYSLKAFKGKLNISANYEMGSGVEAKKEFSYVQVSAGQGVYSWSDYNGNGVKELDEFEVAVFSDQANYIRVLIVTDDYIRTFGNKLNLSIITKPFKLISINTLYNSSLKLQTTEIIQSLNPFLREPSVGNLVFMNSNFRNSVYFNKSGRIFNGEWNFVLNENNYLLVNGEESKINIYNELNTRVALSKKITLNTRASVGRKVSESEYFASRDFNIKHEYYEPQISFQTSKSFRFSIIYRYSEKVNTSGISANELLFGNSVTTSIKWVAPKKSIVNFTMAYLNFNYNAESNTAVGYEMLEGFKSGENIRWSFGFQRQIAENLQLNFSYEGRKPASSKTIHTGSVQLRAFF